MGKGNRLERSRCAPVIRRLVGGAVVVAVASISVAAAAGAVTVAHPPGVFTGGVSNLSASSVVLEGAVNPQGHATTYVFQYGTSVAYGAQTSSVPVGGGAATIKVSRSVGGLRPYTTYHYRIVATSQEGTKVGADRTFKTPKVPLSLQIAPSPNPVLYSDPFTVGGTLGGTDAPGRAVALQINPFPYTSGFTTAGNPEVVGATGTFSFPVVGLLENAQLRVVTTRAPFLSSPVVFESVAVRVSFHIHRVHRHRRGRYYRMYGTVAPAEAGALVGFQLLRPGRGSVNVGGTVVHSGTPTVSRFSTVARVRHRGLYAALVKVADGAHVSAYSAAIRIR
jgi:hypothetical protein